MHCRSLAGPFHRGIAVLEHSNQDHSSCHSRCWNRSSRGEGLRAAGRAAGRAASSGVGIGVRVRVRVAVVIAAAATTASRRGTSAHRTRGHRTSILRPLSRASRRHTPTLRAGRLRLQVTQNVSQA